MATHDVSFTLTVRWHLVCWSAVIEHGRSDGFTTWGFTRGRAITKATDRVLHDELAARLETP